MMEYWSSLFTPKLSYKNKFWIKKTFCVLALKMLWVKPWFHGENVHKIYRMSIINTILMKQYLQFMCKAYLYQCKYSWANRALLFLKARIAIEFYPAAILWTIRFLFLNTSHDAISNENKQNKACFYWKIINKKVVSIIYLLIMSTQFSKVSAW